MTKLLKIIGISAVVLAGASAARAQISVRIGEPPPPRVYRVPPQPAPEYIWVEGYWYPQGRRYAWHDGYWTRPPYQGAYWIAPYNVNRVASGATRGETSAVRPYQKFRLMPASTLRISRTLVGRPKNGDDSVPLYPR